MLGTVPTVTSAADAVPLLGDLLRDAARRHPDRDALVRGDRRSTYAWLDRAADGFAATLLEHGVTPGDVVCLLLPSSIRFVACALGAVRAGAVVSPVNLRLGPSERASIVERTSPRVTVTGEGVDAPAAASGRGTVLAVEDLGRALGATPSAAADLPRLTPEDPVCISWTSGTTGAPKGAVFDTNRLAAIARNLGVATIDGERRLVVLPFAHVGFMTRLWDELTHGTTILTTGEPWRAAEMLRVVRDEHPTAVTAVPTQWMLVLDHPDASSTDWSSLRVLGVGGALTPPGLVDRLAAVTGRPLLSRYNSTEAGVGTSTRLDDPIDTVRGAVGRPGPDVELLLVDEDGAPVAPGEVGELWLRSPCVMREYWDDPVTTASVLDDDGWLHSGDLGRLDVGGNLVLTGRRKEMYLRGGYNVYPAEVEAVLAAHPQIAAVCVVGVPDPVRGEQGVAFVVPVPGVAHDDPRLMRDALAATVRAQLADYKAPDRVVILDALPLTSMLKPDTRALIELAGTA